MWDNRLKMTQDHYNVLSATINDLIVNVGRDTVRDYRKTVKYVNDQFTSFVWGIFHESTDRDFRKELYQYLNDIHVETALKSILEAYKEVV